MPRPVQEWRKLGLCTRCGKVLATKGRRYCEWCRLQNNKANRHSHVRKRDEVFEAYGGYVCACCGETTREFLTIDHIHGGGSKHRKSLPGGHLYTWLRANNFPSGFRVLCYNCNIARSRDCGVCPHERIKGFGMRVDEFSDSLLQPQQDKIVKIKVADQLVDFDVVVDHKSGFFVIEPKETK